jgi:hypothetical protein
MQRIENQNIKLKAIMKTIILTIFSALIVSSGIPAKTYAAVVKSENVTVLTGISAINKIEVRGNVELYISDGAADQVKVYNKYYTESALVQSTNGVLRIASYKAEKLVVWVTAADLLAVSAYDNTEVKSFGSLSKIEFNVDLHNNALANLNLDAFRVTVDVAGHAKANLTGAANNYYLSCELTSTVNNYDFRAIHATIHTVGAPAETQDDSLAGL